MASPTQPGSVVAGACYPCLPGPSGLPTRRSRTEPKHRRPLTDCVTVRDASRSRWRGVQRCTVESRNWTRIGGPMIRRSPGELSNESVDSAANMAPAHGLMQPEPPWNSDRKGTELDRIVLVGMQVHHRRRSQCVQLPDRAAKNRIGPEPCISTSAGGRQLSHSAIGGYGQFDDLSAERSVEEVHGPGNSLNAVSRSLNRTER